MTEKLPLTCLFTGDSENLPRSGEVFNRSVETPVTSRFVDVHKTVPIHYQLLTVDKGFLISAG